jgi:hypothetical protein
MSFLRCASFLLLFAVAALVAVTSSVSATARSVSFYTPFPADGAYVVDWLREAAEVAKTGGRPVANSVYYCCNVIKIQDSGVVDIFRTDSEMAAAIRPPAAAGLSVHIVMGITMKAVLSRTWRNTAALSDIANNIARNRYGGVVVDYEPDTDYTDEHAALYAEFLSALQQRVTAVAGPSASVAWCSAGWGVINPAKFGVYRGSTFNFSTSMTPTYNWPGTLAPLAEFVDAEISSLGVRRVELGLGTVLVPPYVPEWHYGWNPAALSEFLTFLTSKNATRIAWWRSDIDKSYPAKATAPWIFAQSARFLAGDV